MIVGLYFNWVMAKKPPFWHKIDDKFWHKVTNKTALLNSKLKTTIDHDRCPYILVVLHQSFIKGICGML